MKKECTLEELILSLSQETEERLSLELDNMAMPVHHFSHKYQKRKGKILKACKRREPVLPEVHYLRESEEIYPSSLLEMIRTSPANNVSKLSTEKHAKHVSSDLTESFR